MAPASPHGSKNFLDFPATRYQGSKRKLLKWIWSRIGHLPFDSVLDLFSGSSAVSYMFKCVGKRVVSNDYLQSNATIARALIVNDGVQFSEMEARPLFHRKPRKHYDSFIAQVFHGIFYTDDENKWLDTVAQNLADMAPSPKRDLAYFALFQACLAKRPYNLFHRANLYMRLSDVKRSFGNKTTWDKSFEDHFLSNLRAANQAVFSNGLHHDALCRDAKDVGPGYDLVYVDPPYLNGKGIGVDYLDFYHFLEGLTEYGEWKHRITTKYKHKPYMRKRDGWLRKDTILGEFERIIRTHEQSHIVISYRSNGIPAIGQIESMITSCGRQCLDSSERTHQYVLATRKVQETLLVVTPQ